MSKSIDRKQLRAYQSRLVRLLGDHFASGERKVALISPTGSGKSLMVTTLLGRLRDAEVISRAVVCVPQSHIKTSFQFSGLVSDAGDEFTPRKLPTVTDVRGLADVDAAGKASVRFAAQLAGQGPRFAYVCTHAALSRPEAIAAVKTIDLAGVLLVIDEGHHSTNDKQANRLSRLRDAWLAAGGSVLLVTATPYRTDGTPVIDDEWARVSRSIADQCADGFAPEHLECRHRPVNVKARSRSEFEDGGKASKMFVQAIVQDWSDDSRPKAIVIVPQTDSQGWAKMLTRAFAQRGARVFDATGTTKRKRDEVRAVLEREGFVTRWEDSQIDVMIGCKRFDEGTDWPLCSHIFVIGYPVSIGTTVQRWGRATRSKDAIAGHQFPEVASITFYVHAWSKELRDDIMKWKKGGLTLHRETSHLLAAHMHDWQTGQDYAKAYRGIWDSLRRSGSRKQQSKVTAIEQSIVMTEVEQARAIADIDEAKAKLGLDPASTLRGGDLQRVVEAVALRRGEDRAGAVAQLLVERSLTTGKSRDEAIADAIGSQCAAGQAQSLVRREMREKFRAIVESLDMAYRDHAAERRLADVARWNGEQIKELAERMAFEASEPWGEEYEAAILAGAEKYLAEQGRRPPVNGDATAYLGVVSTWQGTDSNLRQGSRGLSPCGGLNDLLDAHGVGVPNKPRDRTEAGLRRAVRSFWVANDRAPSYDDLKPWGLWCTRTGLSFADVRDEELSSELDGRSVRSFAVERMHAQNAGDRKSGRNSLLWWMSERQISASRLAVLSGVCKATVMAVGRGRESKPDTKKRIAAALGLTPDQIKWDK